MSEQRNAPAVLPPGIIRNPLYRRLGGPQGWSRWVRNISAQPGFDPRTRRVVASRYTDYASAALGCWEKLWNDCHTLCIPPDIITMIRSAIQCAADNIKTDMHNQRVRMWPGFILLRIGSQTSSFEHGNQSLGSVKGEEFLDQLYVSAPRIWNCKKAMLPATGVTAHVSPNGSSSTVFSSLPSNSVMHWAISFSKH